MIWARVVLIVAALGFALFGMMMFLHPAQSLAQFGMPVPDAPQLLIELRAFYGGLEIGLAIFLLSGLHDRSSLLICLRAAGICYFAVGAARAWGMLTQDFANTYLWSALATELLISAGCLYFAQATSTQKSEK
jgi:Domain of unknown function (DUF4345)